MKHFYIALFLFLLIISTGIFSHIYIKNTIDIMTTQLYAVDNERTSESIDKLKTIFDNKKNMLVCFLNKEHINEIEFNIILLENRLNENNEENYTEIKLKIINDLNQLYETPIDFI